MNKFNHIKNLLEEFSSTLYVDKLNNILAEIEDQSFNIEYLINRETSVSNSQDIYAPNFELFTVTGDDIDKETEKANHNIELYLDELQDVVAKLDRKSDSFWENALEIGSPSGKTPAELRTYTFDMIEKYVKYILSLVKEIHESKNKLKSLGKSSNEY